ncbi:MAG TPA: hypothetical protein VFN54_06055 [Acidimicrobiales bacterium]|nr:hypothetical protein [Acidimicrobiales bacterium]
MTTDLIAQLRREWQRSGRSPDAVSALARLRDRHPDLKLEGLDDLYDVVSALEIRGGRTVLERAEIVTALLEEASDPRVHRALLQTLVPGVVSVCRQLRFGQGIIVDPGETFAVALGFLSELLVDWAGQHRAYAAPDLLSALRGRLRRWLLKEKGAVAQVSAFDVMDVAAEMSSTLEARLASYRGGPEDRLARLTYARVFEGRSLRDLAQADHSSPTSLRGELQRFARRCLV